MVHAIAPQLSCWALPLAVHKQLEMHGCTWPADNAPQTLDPKAQNPMQGVLADVSIATGYVTIVLMLGGRFVFQWFGWQAAAATTPVLMLIR